LQKPCRRVYRYCRSHAEEFIGIAEAMQKIFFTADYEIQSKKNLNKIFYE
jgi:hypothetical protein